MKKVLLAVVVASMVMVSVPSYAFFGLFDTHVDVGGISMPIGWYRIEGDSRIVIQDQSRTNQSSIVIFVERSNLTALDVMSLGACCPFEFEDGEWGVILYTPDEVIFYRTSPTVFEARFQFVDDDHYTRNMETIRTIVRSIGPDPEILRNLRNPSLLNEWSFSQIRNGMTMEQVVEYIGEPYRLFRMAGNERAYQWIGDNRENAGVTFRNGRVVHSDLIFQ